MTGGDPYQTLGVAPDADEPTVRAAYRAAMKRFHPDQNSSADAAERAGNVAAAYRLLSDPAARARFDRQRQYREQVIVPTVTAPPRNVARGRVGGLLLVVLSAGIVGFAVSRLAPQKPSDPRIVAERHAPSGGNDHAPTEALAAVKPPLAPRLPSPSAAIPVASPLPTPPPAAHPNQAAHPDERLATAPFPSPSPILASVALSGRKPAMASAAPANSAVPSSPATQASPATSDDCSTASTCARIDLAALERMQSLLYNQSYLNAPPAKQAQLLATRATFLARLGLCGSAACKRDAYLDRNREIAALMRN